MDETNFFERFNKLLDRAKRDYELENHHDALILWFLENYYGLDSEDIKERIVEDSHAEGVDGIFVDQRKFNLLFVQGETATTLKKAKNHFKETKLKNVLQGARFLLRGDYIGKITPELENYTKEYHELEKTGNYNTKIIFITMKKKVKDGKYIDDFKKDFPDIEILFFDFDFIKDFYENTYLISRSPAPEQISFQVITNILKKDEPFKARVFTTTSK